MVHYDQNVDKSIDVVSTNSYVVPSEKEFNKITTPSTLFHPQVMNPSPFVLTTLGPEDKIVFLRTMML